MAKKSKKNPNRQQKSINLDEVLWDKIASRAKKENRTQSNMVEVVLEKEFA